MTLAFLVEYKRKKLLNLYCNAGNTVSRPFLINYPRLVVKLNHKPAGCRYFRS
jgi:hypothetical protein